MLRSGGGFALGTLAFQTGLTETIGGGATSLLPARAANLDPVLPALGATMGASLGFMLPVSTPCNAIVYGSGVIPLSRMMKAGLILDVVGTVVMVAVVSLLGPLVR